MSKKKITRWFNLQFAITSLLLATLGYIGVNCYISDSEFWAITLAKELFNPNTDQIGLYYKIPFYLLLNIPHAFAKNNLDVIIFSRVIFVVVSWFVVASLYRLAYEVVRSRRFAFTSVFLLLSTTFYAAHSIRVRSDILSSLLFLVLFYIVLTEKRSGWQLRWPSLATFFGLSVLMCLTTPKSVFFILILFFILLWERCFLRGEARLAINRFLWALISPLLAIAYLAVTLLIWSHNQAYLSYSSALDLFKNNLLAGITDFYSLKVFLGFNPLYAVAFIISVGAGTKSVASQLYYKLAPEKKHFVYLANALAFIILLLHSQRLQFFMASLLPLSALQLALFLNGLASRFKFKAPFKFKTPFRFNLSYPSKLNLRRLVPAAVTLYALLMVLLTARYVAKNLNNVIQLESVQMLEKYLKHNPEIKYYDSVGVLPLLPQDYAYISPLDGMYDFHAQKIIMSEPDVVVVTARVTLILHYLQKFLEQNYLQLDSGFWVKKIFIEKFSPAYRLFLADVYALSSQVNSGQVNSAQADSAPDTPIKPILSINAAELLYFLLKDQVPGNTVYVYHNDPLGFIKPAHLLFVGKGAESSVRFTNMFNLDGFYDKLSVGSERLSEYEIRAPTDAYFLSSQPNLVNATTSLDINAAELLYELLLDNVSGATVYAYDKDPLGVVYPSTLLLQNKVSGATEVYHGSLDLAALQSTLALKGFALSDYEIKVSSNLHVLSAHPPFRGPQYVGNFKLLFSYDSSF